MKLLIITLILTFSLFLNYTYQQTFLGETNKKSNSVYYDVSDLPVQVKDVIENITIIKSESNEYSADYKLNTNEKVEVTVSSRFFELNYFIQDNVNNTIHTCSLQLKYNFDKCEHYCEARLNYLRFFVDYNGTYTVKDSYSNRKLLITKK